MHCPSCGRSDVFEDTTVWCDNCKEWVDIEDYHAALEHEIIMLREQLEDLKEHMAEMHEHMATRIEIESTRPPLSLGKPCPKCGQEVR
jgi:hypothetical protein